MMRKALFSGVTTFVMLLAIAVVFEPASTMAQPPGGGGGRGPGGGRGGMMGGMGGGGILAILNNPESRDELKLTDEQVAKVRGILDSIKPDGDKFREIAGKIREASDDERGKLREEMNKLSQDMAKKVDEEAAKILDEAQYKRVKQLALRAGGVRLITTDENAKALGLTDEQKEKITGILRENRGGFGGGGGGGGNRPSREERAKQQEELQEKVSAVLTDDQKTKWKEMLGPEPAPAN